MPRPIRIEFEDAYYHVMNRGRARQKVFHGKLYFEAFLKTLEESHSRFGLQKQIWGGRYAISMVSILNGTTDSREPTAHYSEVAIKPY